MSTEKTLLRARSLAKKGAYTQAQALYVSILDKFPNNKRALNELAALRSKVGVRPLQLLLKDLFELYQGRHLVDLEKAATEALELHPGSTDILTLLAAAQGELGRPVDAVATYNRLLELDPDNTDALGNRGNAQRADGDVEAALASFEAVLARRPGDPAALNNIGTIQIETGALDDAQSSFEQALASEPKYGPALNNLGNVLKIKGHTEDAARVLSASVNNGTASAETYWNLVSVKRFGPDDAEIAVMEGALNDAQRSENERMLLGFALGKAYEDVGDFKTSFERLVGANKRRKADLRYRVANDLQHMERQKVLFSDRGSNDGSPGNSPAVGPVPIFITGMPRSGTSLVEQMLSAHGDVHGGGEIELLNERLSKLDWSSMDDLNTSAEALRSNYLAHLVSLSDDARFVTDKLPVNFMWIGAIRTIFPEAKIIHVQRNARATCWSNFKHFFSSRGNGFAYDLDDVVTYYCAYRNLMAHWHQAFPGDIHDLDYDRMTEDAEPAIRNLLAYIGIPWEDACLAPEKNKRAVYSSSATQVRRKIYQGSSEGWKKFEPYIGGAFDALPQQ